MSLFLETKRAGYRAQRSCSKGASITLVSAPGCFMASFECAARAAEVLGSRDLQDLGDGIIESIPVLCIPLETLEVAIHKLIERFSVALVDLVCDEASSRFVLLWKVDQRVPEPEPQMTTESLNPDEY